MTGIERAARQYIELRIREDGRKPSSVACNFELFARLLDGTRDLARYRVPSGNKIVDFANDCLSDKSTIREITLTGVDFFPDPNGIKAF